MSDLKFYEIKGYYPHEYVAIYEDSIRGDWVKREDAEKLQQRIAELEAQVPRWNDGLPQKEGVYLVEKPSSQYLPFAVCYFDGEKFDCPYQYIGKWIEIPKEQYNG